MTIIATAMPAAARRRPSPRQAFRGLYLRRSAGGPPVARISYDAPIRTGARLGGNARWLAVECHDRVDLIDRQTGTAHALHGTAVALDPHRLRIARAIGDTIQTFDAGAWAA